MFKDISIVMQGDIRNATIAAIKSVRKNMPGAYLILSTFHHENTELFSSLVDELVISPDPGVLPAFTIAENSEPSNINRQIVTSQAGLKRVKTPYTLKLRTDALIKSSIITNIYKAIHSIDPSNDRLIVSNFYTRHPSGLSCYQFHISDWFIFGSTTKVAMFWDTPLMSLEDAKWFENHTHISGSSLSATRFRARLTPEQYITTAFASKLGYKIPSFLNERNKELVLEYQRFLGKEFVVVGCQESGVELPKYSHLGNSLYLRLDCVSFRDWFEFFQYSSDEYLRTQVTSLLAFCTDKPKTYFIKRKHAHQFRHILIRLILIKRKINNLLTKFRPFSFFPFFLT